MGSTDDSEEKSKEKEEKFCCDYNRETWTSQFKKRGTFFKHFPPPPDGFFSDFNQKAQEN